MAVLAWLFASPMMPIKPSDPTAPRQVLPVLRSGDDLALRQAIMDSMGIKPFGHDFSNQMNNPQVIRFMSMTGG